MINLSVKCDDCGRLLYKDDKVICSSCSINKPKVTLEWVEKWEHEFSEWAYECPRREGMVKTLLREAGVEVEEDEHGR